MFIASVSSTIKFHEFPSGNVIHNYQPGKVEGPIRSISWSKDGNWLIVVPYMGEIEIVSTKEQLKLLKTLHEVNEPTYACFQNTTKKNIGIGTKGGLVLIYDIKSRNVKKRFSRVSSDITQLAFTANDSHCVVGCKNGDVFVYNNVTNGPASNLRIPKSMSISSLKTNIIKRNFVMGGSNEGIVVVWDINISRPKFCKEAHKSGVNAVAFSPVNSDLILTAGADRQFSFYDIADSKCIANISVNNSITSVDFSPDGTYFVTACQNGQVYVYDSRNVHDPVHSFLAHKSTINHIAFQYAQDSSSNSSICSISTESLVASGSTEPVANRRRSRNNRYSDFFNDVFAAPEVSPIDPSIEGDDSFLVALGLGKNNSVDYSKHDSVFLKEVNRLPSIHDESLVSNTSKSVKESDKCVPGISKQMSSTPKLNFINKPDLTQQNATATISNISVDDIKTIVKDVFNNECKSAISELKNDIKYQGTHVIYQVRTMLIDMQMNLIREFIKVEEINNKIKEEFNTFNFDNSLLEENEKLRKHIQFLEEQLRNATTKDE